jgi:SAM-dependent methyltransferase
MKSRQAIKTWSTPGIEEERRPVSCVLCGNTPSPGNSVLSVDTVPSVDSKKFKPSLSCEGFSYVKCTVCGLVQMNPQPLVSEVERRYKQLHGQDYFLYEMKNETAFLDLQKLALADAGFDKIERELMEHQGRSPDVLDIGCATGGMLTFLRDRGWKATGVEISPSAEYAQAKQGLDIRRHNLEDCHFPSESFDVALASHVIEHLNNPESFIREARRVLRPGGYFLITTPNINGFQAWLFGSRWRSAIFDHLYLFSARTLSALLKKANFIPEGIYTWGGLAEGIAPPFLKRFADRAAKPLGLGDVMLIKARKS